MLVNSMYDRLNNSSEMNCRQALENELLAYSSWCKELLHILT